MNIIKKYEDLPRLSENGFQKTKVPKKAWKLISELYDLLKPSEKEEVWKEKEKFIPSENGSMSSTIMNLNQFPKKKLQLFEMLKPLHDEFCGNEPITPSAMYGIRTYLNGSKMVMHRDVLATHHISSIISVDKDLGGKKDWPLEIEDHKGKMHKVYLNPGEMVLYESAVCEHGRPKVFKGKTFRNFFCHYKLSNYTHENWLTDPRPRLWTHERVYGKLKMPDEN